MTREEQLAIAAREYASFLYKGLDDLGYISAYTAFIEGDKWAEKHPINPWHKFTEEFPPKDGTEVLIAMRNKNMMEDGIWLYDVCFLVVAIILTITTGKVKLIGKRRYIGNTLKNRQHFNDNYFALFDFFINFAIVK